MSARAGLKIGPSWLLEELSAGRPTQGCAGCRNGTEGPCSQSVAYDRGQGPQF